MPVTRTQIHGKKEGFLWVDVTAPTGDDVSSLAKEFGFHHLALEDSVHNIERPKIEDYGGYSFIVAKHLEYTHKLDRKQISFFVGSGFIVTVHKDELGFLNDIRDKLTSEEYRISDTPDYVLYAILDEIIDRYFTVVDKLSEDIDRTEHASLKAPSKKTLEQVLKMRKDLIRIRRHVWPLREVLHTMQSGLMPGITKTMYFYFRDLYDHVVRVIDLTEMQREILASILEIYLSSLSNSMNEVIRVLTVLTSLILVPTLIAGIYGMNFRYMPELSWKYGYPFSIGLMVLSVIVIWFAFKKKKWI